MEKQCVWWKSTLNHIVRYLRSQWSHLSLSSTRGVACKVCTVQEHYSCYRDLSTLLFTEIRPIIRQDAHKHYSCLPSLFQHEDLAQNPLCEHDLVETNMAKFLGQKGDRYVWFVFMTVGTQWWCTYGMLTSAYCPGPQCAHEQFLISWYHSTHSKYKAFRRTIKSFLSW